MADLDYSDVAALDITTPDGDTEKVSSADDYLRDIKGMLKGWYQAMHQWISVTSLGAVDLSSIGTGESPAVAHAGCIKYTAGATGLSQFTNGIIGQLVFVWNDGTGDITVTASANLLCGADGATNRKIVPDAMACFKMTAANTAYEVPVIANA